MLLLGFRCVGHDTSSSSTELEVALELQSAGIVLDVITLNTSNTTALSLAKAAGGLACADRPLMQGLVSGPPYSTVAVGGRPKRRFLDKLSLIGAHHCLQV